MYVLVAKRYNDVTSDNIILCVYMNKCFPSAYSN